MNLLDKAGGKVILSNHQSFFYLCRFPIFEAKLLARMELIAFAYFPKVLAPVPEKFLECTRPQNSVPHIQ